tara:strand:+ start:211 stop:723 length:513 start_codon:yes stop_codon:yes gene_type:complete
MLLFKKFILLLIIFFTITSNASSNEQIAFLDLDNLMSQTNSGKSIIKNLKDLNEKNISTLKLKEDKLKKMEDDINKQKNIISENEIKSKINILQNEIKDFRIQKEKLIKTFQDKKNNELNNFFNKVAPIVQQYIDKNNIDIVLDKKNIFMANKKNDITKEIIILINKELK